MKIEKDTPRIELGASIVVREPTQEAEAPTSQETDMHKAERRQRWKWAKGSIWTDNMLAALETG